jgi:hypothetical protein
MFGIELGSKGGRVFAEARSLVILGRSPERPCPKHYQNPV